MATSQAGSTADVGACSDNELVDVENHKNEVRFTFWRKSLDYSEHHRVYIPLNSVGVWQSLRTALPFDTKKQIAAILISPEEEIKLEYANVQVNIYVKNYALISVRL